MSTLKVNTILAGDGTTTTEPSIPALDKRMAAAWVNFNGVGTVAIRDSYNVASITDNGVGDFSVNFMAALPHTNYVFAGGARLDTGVGMSNITVGQKRGGISATTYCHVSGWNTSNGAIDGDRFLVSFFA